MKGGHSTLNPQPLTRGRRFDVEGLRNYPKTVKTFCPQNYYHRGFFLPYNKDWFLSQKNMKSNLGSNFKTLWHFNSRLRIILLPHGAFCNQRLLHQNSSLVQRLITSGNNWVFLPIGFDGGQNYGSICEISKSDLFVSPRLDENWFFWQNIRKGWSFWQKLIFDKISEEKKGWSFWLFLVDMF